MSNLSYNELKEAFERTKRLKEEYSKMDILRLQPGDVVVAYFNIDEIDIETAQQMHKALIGIIPDKVSVITMPDCAQVLAYDKDQYAKEMLNDMYIGLGRDKYIEVLRDELDRIDGDDLK